MNWVASIMALISRGGGGTSGCLRFKLLYRLVAFCSLSGALFALDHEPQNLARARRVVAFSLLKLLFPEAPCVAARVD